MRAEQEAKLFSARDALSLEDQMEAPTKPSILKASRSALGIRPLSGKPIPATRLSLESPQLPVIHLEEVLSVTSSQRNTVYLYTLTHTHTHYSTVPREWKVEENSQIFQTSIEDERVNR